MKLTVSQLTRMLLLFGLCVWSLPRSAEARVHRVWSDAQLMAKADVVVIANPGATKDVEEKSPAKKDWQGVETTFEVEVLLKGDLGRPVPAPPASGEKSEPPATIVLHHYRYADTVGTIINGWSFARFDEKKHKVVMYLKKMPNGSYEPVTGQGDAVDSLRVISTYPEYGHKRREAKTELKK